MKVSVLASSLIGSEIIKIGNEVNEMKRKGASIANLTIGDFDANIYPIPTELKAGIVDATMPTKPIIHQLTEFCHYAKRFQNY